MPHQSTTWAGAVVPAPDGQCFVHVEGTWKVPSVDNTQVTPAGGRWYPVSCWVGIDGAYGEQHVVQAGCDLQVLAGGERKVVPWYQWTDQDFVRIEFQASVGDELSVSVHLDHSMKVATVSFRNVTTGTSYEENVGGRQPAQGNCADWIVEAMLNTAEKPDIRRFTPVEFGNCKAVTLSGITVPPANEDTWHLVDDADPPNTIVAGEVVDPTTVRATYVGP